jgi:hypothetical protein
MSRPLVNSGGRFHFRLYARNGKRVSPSEYCYLNASVRELLVPKLEFGTRNCLALRRALQMRGDELNLAPG